MGELGSEGWNAVCIEKILTGIRQPCKGKSISCFASSKSGLSSDLLRLQPAQFPPPASRSSADSQELQDGDTGILLLILSHIPPHPSPPEHAYWLALLQGRSAHRQHILIKMWINTIAKHHHCSVGHP